MAKYRKVDTRIWNDEKFMALSDTGKLAFFFVMTNPHMTAIGAMRGTVPGLAAELGWKLPKFSRAFMEAVRKGMIDYDEGSAFIALPNFLKYNPPESPNVVKSWRDAIDMLPECAGKIRLASRCVAFAEGLPKGFHEALPKAFREVFAKSMPNQEQEQEQEKDRTEDRSGAAVAQPSSKPSTPNRQRQMVKGVEDWLNDRGVTPPRPGTIAKWIADVEIEGVLSILERLEGNGKLFTLGDGLPAYVYGCISKRTAA